MNQADFENIIALALSKGTAPLSAGSFETAVTLLLRHITPVTAADIEEKAVLLAPAFEADALCVEQAVCTLEKRFLPEYLNP